MKKIRMRRIVLAALLAAGIALGAVGFVFRTQQQAKQAASAEASRGVPMAYASATSLSNGTFTGTREYAHYGWVQVAVVVNGGTVSNVKVLQYPDDNGTSRYINSVALPYLIQEAVQAQDANIDLISGATLTSDAFARSLQSAMTKAGA